jgi:hypothetical protein
MTSVSYLADLVNGAPVLLFDYGILEVGATLGVEQMLREQLIEAGLEPFTSLPEVPHTTNVLRVDGTTGRVWWGDGWLDEYELPQRWLDAARNVGACIAVYRNMTPHEPMDFGDALKGALVGSVAVVFVS